MAYRQGFYNNDIQVINQGANDPQKITEVLNTVGLYVPISVALTMHIKINIYWKLMVVMMVHLDLLDKISIAISIPSCWLAYFQRKVLGGIESYN